MLRSQNGCGTLYTVPSATQAQPSGFLPSCLTEGTASVCLAHKAASGAVSDPSPLLKVVVVGKANLKPCLWYFKSRLPAGTPGVFIPERVSSWTTTVQMELLASVLFPISWSRLDVTFDKAVRRALRLHLPPERRVCPVSLSVEEGESRGHALCSK